MLESLDNPIWSALTTEHRLLARSHGLARRYPLDVSPFAAFLHPTKDAFANLQQLVSPGEHVAFFTASPCEVPGEWEVDRTQWVDQMICEAPLDLPPVPPLPLGTTDDPEMLELTAATEPGPFSPRTIQMGNYFGIRASDGRLVAMAGGAKLERLKRFVNDASKRNRYRSVRVKILASAAFTLIRFGPCKIPRPQLPNRPASADGSANALPLKNSPGALIRRYRIADTIRVRNRRSL